MDSLVERKDCSQELKLLLILYHIHERGFNTSAVPGIMTNIKDMATACGLKKLATELRGKRDETERDSRCRESDNACTQVPGKHKGTPHAAWVTR